MCSVHLVGGKKSNIKNNPSYIPSIFKLAGSADVEASAPSTCTVLCEKGKNMGIVCE